MASEDIYDSTLHYIRIKEIIEENLENAKTYSVIKKMEWAKKQFNTSNYVVSKTVPPITIKVAFLKKARLFPFGLVKMILKKIFL